MYAMQYQVGLPADYNMQIIRDRVRKTGHLMDGFAGLEFKAYLIREKSKGAGRNVYAPFYVWRNIDGMRSFCWGEPGYSAIVRDSAVSRFRTGLFIASLGDQYPMLMRIALLSPPCRYQLTSHPLCV